MTALTQDWTRWLLFIIVCWVCLLGVGVSVWAWHLDRQGRKVRKSHSAPVQLDREFEALLHRSHRKAS